MQDDQGSVDNRLKMQGKTSGFISNLFSMNKSFIWQETNLCFRFWANSSLAKNSSFRFLNNSITLGAKKFHLVFFRKWISLLKATVYGRNQFIFKLLPEILFWENIHFDKGRKGIVLFGKSVRNDSWIISTIFGKWL